PGRRDAADTPAGARRRGAPPSTALRRVDRWWHRRRMVARAGGAFGRPARLAARGCRPRGLRLRAVGRRRALPPAGVGNAGRVDLYYYDRTSSDNRPRSCLADLAHLVEPLAGGPRAPRGAAGAAPPPARS